jgi:Mn2+/Fe2+ NRAMP family transporter
MLTVSITYALYYLPLLVAISLVFAATRHEDTDLILKHAWETARWITLFMLIILAVLLLIDFFI